MNPIIEAINFEKNGTVWNAYTMRNGKKVYVYPGDKEFDEYFKEIRRLEEESEIYGTPNGLKKKIRELENRIRNLESQKQWYPDPVSKYHPWSYQIR